jgi:hypothetical protein
MFQTRFLSSVLLVMFIFGIIEFHVLDRPLQGIFTILLVIAVKLFNPEKEKQ